jgi:TetR/AcrR family transcriptional repressor of lmrAB and yxaGH operons
MSNAKDQILETTCQLMEKQGYHATGLNQIVKESGAPKGSLYYYFPGGKEELVESAINLNGQVFAERIRENLEKIADPAEAVRVFICNIADRIEASGYKSGGPLTLVAMETALSSAHINNACRQAYHGMRKAFADRLLAGGLSEKRAAELSWHILAAIEGGILLSRTFHSGDPLRSIAIELEKMIK